MSGIAKEIVRETKKKLAAQEVPLADKRLVTEACVAQSLGYLGQLPDGPVQDCKQLFLNRVKIPLLRLLSEINESIVVDLDRTMDMAYKFWLVRYSLAFEPCALLNFRLSDALCQTSFVSDQQKEIMGKYCTNVRAHTIQSLIAEPDDAGENNG